MIIKLNEGLRASLFEFLKKESEINLYIIGDVELFGFDKDFQEVWAQLDRDMSYRAVLLRYKTHFVFYSPETEYNAVGFANIITSYKDRCDLSGKKETLYPLLEKLDSHYIMERPSFEDADDIYSLIDQIVEFNDFKSALDTTKELLKGEMGQWSSVFF